MKFTIAFLLVFCTANSWGQLPSDKQRLVDSLTASLKSLKSDTAKARANFLISSSWSDFDFEKAQGYLKTGRQLGGKDRLMQALSYFYEGRIFDPRDLEKSSQAYLTAISLFNKLKTKEAYLLKARAYFNYSINLYKQNESKKCVDVMLNEGIPAGKESRDSVLVSKFYIMLGKVFMNNQQWEKAAAYFKQAIDLLEIVDPKSKILLTAYTRLAFAYCHVDKFNQVKMELDKAKKLIAFFPDSRELLDYYEVEAVYLMMGLQQDNQALATLDKGLALAHKIRADDRAITFAFQKYNVLVNNEKFEKALPILKQIAKDTQFMDVPFNRQQVYKEFNNTYASMGNKNEAYNWLQQYAKITDSLNELKSKKEINELEIKFRNAENQKKIVELNAANEKNKLKAKNNRLIGLIVSLFLLVVAVFGWMLYRKSKKLSDQEELNHKQEIKEIAQREQIKIAQAMLQGQEEERKRVAQDLHDGLGGMLAGVKMNLSVFVAKERKEEQAELYGIIEQLDKSASELRRIAYNMMPETLLRFGLETSLRELCESFVSSQLTIDFQYYGSKNDLPIQEQISIYRIVQELLTNAYKHAHAKKILVQCSQDEKNFLITVEDDGGGFDPHTVNQGMGLANIRNRVDYLKGTIEIVAGAKQQGAQVNIELKLQR
ncbi:sensor histidine kinase [Pedobacter sp. KR3-3]|uniref:histidine kinase n=1 Tax=Pedobacter albus TaxID=3113905 RepID=A0ABU7I357_9SPHI|nr:sensor histidine kinase [Pedobacter sp. KR3-3]MEE1943895.1 sensor histidine kinase [Pedobacter sp. KR3-3]